MMETQKHKLEIERCNNGFLAKNDAGKFIFKDGVEILKQMAKEIEEKLKPGEKMIIEYQKDGTEN